MFYSCFVFVFKYVRDDPGSHHKQDLYHSTIASHKTSRTVTTTLVDISKQAGRLPQHRFKSQNEQDVHHSIIGNFKTSKTFTKAQLQITKRTGRSPKHHWEYQKEQDFHHDIIAISKTSTTFTTTFRFFVLASRTCTTA